MKTRSQTPWPRSRPRCSNFVSGRVGGRGAKPALSLTRLGSAASTAKATATGSRSTIYGSVFYHFDKITEVYVAADYLKLKDGYKVGVTNGAPSQTEFGIGLRTRF